MCILFLATTFMINNFERGWALKESSINTFSVLFSLGVFTFTTFEPKVVSPWGFMLFFNNQVTVQRVGKLSNLK